MKLSLTPPTWNDVPGFLAGLRAEALSYREVGLSRQLPDRGPLPDDYLVDHHSHCLGHGRPTFERACTLLRRWQMFDLPWIRLLPESIEREIAPGLLVLMAARVLGVWWWSACRVVYVLDSDDGPRRFGFAYGTLRAHVARGEERFLVEWRDDDSVWYHLTAFSRPNRWWARLGYVYLRWVQRRFRRESAAAMARGLDSLATCQQVEHD